MERILILLFVCVVAVLSQERGARALKELSSLKYEELPRQLREVVDRQRRKGDNSHWCCEDEQPVRLLQRSKTKVTYEVVKDVVKTGVKSCGLLALGKCSQYNEITRFEPRFSVEYYSVPQKEACPDEAVKCCKGFLLIVGHCLSLEEISTSGMTIEQLIQKQLMSEPQ